MTTVFRLPSFLGRFTRYNRESFSQYFSRLFERKIIWGKCIWLPANANLCNMVTGIAGYEKVINFFSAPLGMGIVFLTSGI
jgi:hypothetical protein